jgi:hypothetical protein
MAASKIPKDQSTERRDSVKPILNYPKLKE